MSLRARSRIQLDVELHHGPSNRWGLQLRVFAIKLRGESMRHVAMKLLSWIAWHRDGLEIERSVDQHHKPDVVHVDEQGRPTLWIDCGATRLTKLERIQRANRDCRFVIVKPSVGEITKYAAASRRRLTDTRSIEWVTFGEGYTSTFAERLHHRHRLTVTVAPDRDRMWIAMDRDEADDVPIVYV